MVEKCEVVKMTFALIEILLILAVRNAVAFFAYMDWISTPASGLTRRFISLLLSIYELWYLSFRRKLKSCSSSNPILDEFFPYVSFQPDTLLPECTNFCEVAILLNSPPTSNPVADLRPPSNTTRAYR